MTDSDELENFENLLHSADVMAFSIMGTDKRMLSEIVQNDIDRLSQSGVTVAKLVERMKEITEKSRYKPAERQTQLSDFVKDARLIRELNQWQEDTPNRRGTFGDSFTYTGSLCL